MITELKWRAYIDSAGKVTDLSDNGERREHIHTLSYRSYGRWKCSPWDRINGELILNGIPGCLGEYGIETALKNSWRSWR